MFCIPNKPGQEPVTSGILLELYCWNPLAAKTLQ